jgi:oligoendopeptidase F
MLLGGAASLAAAGLVGRSARAAETLPAIWDLSDLYASSQAWIADQDAIAGAIAELPKLAGTLGKGPGALVGVLQAISDADRRVRRLNAYATLVADADTTATAGQERRQRALALSTKLAAASAWLRPEVLALGREKVAQFEAAEPRLGKFRVQLDGIVRAAPHTLGAEAEAVLAAGGDVFAGPQAIRTQLVASDLPRQQVSVGGALRRIDDQAFTALRDSPDRADRKAVFESFFAAYKPFESTLGATLAALVQGNVLKARSRRFDGALQAALFPNDIPIEVYRNLVAETNAGLPVLHRYFAVRRRLMGLPDLRYYDLYPPLVPTKRSFGLDETRQLTLAAVQPLGPDYVRSLSHATAAGWMDAYPRKGKLGGAYTNPNAYDVHPYVLLNHTGNYDSVTTFTHEWGHAMHAVLADRSQPFETAGYAIFTSEIASTHNEQLLAHHMYETASDDSARLFYLTALLELYRGTYFRQVMFAEFELSIHQAVERGEALSGAKLSATYLALLRKYHGEEVRIDPLYGIEWAYPPHFFRNFYVFQYATSLAASAYFSEQVLVGGRVERETYLNVLRAGGSDYPVAILRKAGLDMASPVPYRALIAKFSRTLDQVEALVARRA